MAEGSQTTYGGWEPRTCCICELPIVKGDGRSHRFEFNDVTGERRSWHVECETLHGWSESSGV